jgi:hypothetical protein
METTIASASAEKEQAEKAPPSEIPVIGTVKKYIYRLPSGRRLKVIVDDETEMAAELAMLRPYLIA